MTARKNIHQNSVARKLIKTLLTYKKNRALISKLFVDFARDNGLKLISRKVILRVVGQLIELFRRENVTDGTFIAICMQIWLKFESIDSFKRNFTIFQLRIE